MHEANLEFKIDDASDSYLELFAKEFIDKNVKTINHLCFSVYKENSKLSMLAFQEIMLAEVKKACYSFVNNNHDPKYIEAPQRIDRFHTPRIRRDGSRCIR